MRSSAMPVHMCPLDVTLAVKRVAAAVPDAPEPKTLAVPDSLPLPEGGGDILDRRTREEEGKGKGEEV